MDGAVDGVAYLKPKKEDKKKKKRQAARGSSVVTLMVTPQDAEVLALVTEVGEVNLLLRGLTDEGDIETTGVDVIDVFGIPYEEIETADGSKKNADEGESRPSTAATRAADANRRRSLRRRNTTRRYRRPPIRSRQKTKKKPELNEGEFSIGPTK